MFNHAMHATRLVWHVSSFRAISQCVVRATQRAMRLSAEQARTLSEECARWYARSAALRRERTALAQQLDVQMASDDGNSQQRIAQVSGPIGGMRPVSARLLRWHVSFCCCTQPHSARTLYTP